jgi:hypothetical protein
MNKLKKINTLSFAKFQALLMGLTGVLFGILYSFGGLFIDTLVSLEIVSPELASTPGLSFGTVLAFGALIGMPLLFAFLGFLFGIIEALLFNLVAKRFGGIQVPF